MNSDKSTISSLEANCAGLKTNCEYTIGSLEIGQAYNFAVTAIDKVPNEYTDVDIAGAIVS